MDADNSQSACLHCGAAFTWLNLRHHCRLCGHVVCHACAGLVQLDAGAEQDSLARLGVTAVGAAVRALHGSLAGTQGLSCVCALCSRQRSGWFHDARCQRDELADATYVAVAALLRAVPFGERDLQALQRVWPLAVSDYRFQSAAPEPARTSTEWRIFAYLPALL